MKTAKELVAMINAAKVPSPHCIDVVIDMCGVTKVGTMDTDEHRWYISATVVFQVGDEYFGVFGPVSLKSEAMEFGDTGVDCTAFEMIAVPSITYKVKEL